MAAVCPRSVVNQRVRFLFQYRVGFTLENRTSYCRNIYSLILEGRTPTDLLRFFCYLPWKFGDFRDK